MSYEVQTLTICDGWINTWTVLHPDGSSEPEIFETAEEAQAALDELFAEFEAEIAAGQRAPDEIYDRSEFRIAKAGAA